jgi:hypothetical protein
VAHSRLPRLGRCRGAAVPCRGHCSEVWGRGGGGAGVVATLEAIRVEQALVRSTSEADALLGRIESIVVAKLSSSFQPSTVDATPLYGAMHQQKYINMKGYNRIALNFTLKEIKMLLFFAYWFNKMHFWNTSNLCPR